LALSATQADAFTMQPLSQRSQVASFGLRTTTTSTAVDAAMMKSPILTAATTTTTSTTRLQATNSRGNFYYYLGNNRLGKSNACNASNGGQTSSRKAAALEANQANDRDRPGYRKRPFHNLIDTNNDGEVMLGGRTQSGP
jgi:hypothetical protein